MLFLHIIKTVLPKKENGTKNIFIVMNFAYGWGEGDTADTNNVEI